MRSRSSRRPWKFATKIIAGAAVGAAVSINDFVANPNIQLLNGPRGGIVLALCFGSNIFARPRQASYVRNIDGVSSSFTAAAVDDPLRGVTTAAEGRHAE